MKKIALIFLVIIVHINGLLGQKEIQLEDIWSFKFYPKSIKETRWMNNDKFYSQLTENNDLLKISVENSSQIDTIINGKNILYNGKKINIDDYILSAEENKVIFLTESQSIYRHSQKNVCYIFDITSKKITQLFDGKSIMYPTFSPSGNMVAFAFENNLYYQSLNNNKLIQITNDGKLNSIINGTTDWVYEEEFGFTTAFAWSNDNNNIAYYRFDETNVPEFTMMTYGELYPQKYTFKYPKAGENNSTVELFSYNVKLAKSTKINLDSDAYYIPRIKWLMSEPVLAIMKMNRLQNKNEVVLFNATTSKTNSILTEKSDTYIEQVEDNSWVFFKNEFLWMSERDGYNHIYLYDIKGNLIKQLTKGTWDVSALYGVNTKSNVVYFQASKVSSIERHIYSINLDGSNLQQLTKEEGWHNATFSNDFSYFIDSYSNSLTPPFYKLVSNSGNVIKVLETNEKLSNSLKDYSIASKEFTSIKTEDGVELNTWVIKPPNFVEGKKYPLFMFVYGGPGSQQVTKQYDPFNFFWFQHLAQKGYVIACVDNRGTGGKGAQFKKCTYKELGKFEVKDQIEAAKVFASYSYIDASRIGIWGWSYGGYMSSLCITKGADVFKAAIAVAPVTNWRYYDTIYTERYMQTPKDNANGYDENSPINHVEKLKGNYLIIHGSADDNVHYQNTIEMVNSLVEKGKQFEMFIYPDKNHSIFGKGTRLHLYKKMTEFVINKL